MPEPEDRRAEARHLGPLAATRGRLPWADVAGCPLVAFRAFQLFGKAYFPGMPVPRDAAPDRVLRNLYNCRRLDAAPEPDPEPLAEDLSEEPPEGLVLGPVLDPALDPVLAAAEAELAAELDADIAAARALMAEADPAPLPPLSVGLQDPAPPRRRMLRRTKAAGG